MSALAIFVFIALQYFKAGYGFLRTPQWGYSIPNKIGWVIMEAPVFITMCILYGISDRIANVTIIIITTLFLTHYLQRSFIFPFLIRGKNEMPVAIIAMGMIFNVINAYMQGRWIYTYSPENMYSVQWLVTPQFIIGTIIFILGMYINLQSDYIIRHLRKPGDSNHYIPKGGMFKYVSSANYFGEILEWVGFAILTWSVAGVVFLLWTCANLVPRANSLYEKYKDEFGEEFTSLHRKRVIPFIY
ncbi:MAG: DUF1295 domain-containing protein [Bacteroidales bacterium]|nr:DUF1295 domain-containing protein [Bacteroidales bacterium]MDD4670626.1 DUF1295 domain-containing protein [Bacteroidales bacterium]